MAKRWHTTLLGLVAVTSSAWSLPEGGQVVQGAVQIVQPGTNILQIMQSSPSGIINWGSFNIDANQLVQFLQPNSSAALLNRVVGQSPSQILGQLQANGRILLVNPNGMLFGPGSSINAGSFLASTLSIQDQDFLEGRYDLRWDGTSPMRALVNQGEIRVNEGGFLALISPLIDNQGLLLAERGQVVLGATRQATLTVDAQGLLQVTIPDGFAAHSGPIPNSQAVLLTPGQMSDTLAQLIRPAAGSESATMVETAQGIQLLGAEGVLVNQGVIRADALQGRAGSILLDSSQATVLAPQGLVSASSAQGDGGDILALSAGATVQMGQLQARSQSAGDGGFIEVSGRGVHITRGPDLSAPEGRAGEFLVDPFNITVVAAGGTSLPDILFGSSLVDLTVDASALNATFGGPVILEADNNLFIDDGVQVNIDTATQLQLSAGENFEMRPGSAINATDPGASVSINATNFAKITDLKAPTNHIKAGTVEFLGGTVGQPTSDTVLNVSADQVTVFAGTQLDVVGQNRATVALNATQSVTLDPDSQINLAATHANLTLQGDGAGVNLLDRSSINSPGPANVSLSSANSRIQFLGGSSIQVGGVGNITMNSPTAEVFVGNGTVNATNPASTVNISSAGQLTVGNLNVPTMNLNSTGVVQLRDANLGAAGSPTLLNVTGGGVVAAFGGTPVTIHGSSANVSVTSGSDILFSDDSTFSVKAPANVTMNATTDITMRVNSLIQDTGGGNYSFTGDRVLMDPSATINASNPASRVSMNATTYVEASNLRVPNIQLNSSGDLGLRGGTLGQAGAATSFQGNATGQAFLFTNSILAVEGSPVNFQLSAQDLRLGNANSTVDFRGTSNNVSLFAVNNNVFAPNSTLTASGPTRLQISAGNRVILNNATLTVPDAASNISLQSPGSILVHRVQTGGRFSATTTAGNLRITDQVRANDLILSTPDELQSLQATGQPAVVANHTLDLTAGRIFGPINDPSQDITSSFPIATSPAATVRLQVTGTNNTATGNRAANLYYYFPQSGDVQVVNPSGDVKIFYEQGTRPPLVQPGIIDSKDDLTPQQIAEITSVGALTQIQMSNLYSAEYLPSTSDVLMLEYHNIGLTHHSMFPLSSALVELVVLSPEDAALRRIKGSVARATSLVIPNDDDSELRFWRRLIEGFILWEED
jgi:filamentous hemagglutinin family protein